MPQVVNFPIQCVKLDKDIDRYNMLISDLKNFGQNQSSCFAVFMLSMANHVQIPALYFKE